MKDFIESLIEAIFVLLNISIILLASIDMLGIFGNTVNTMDIIFNFFIIFICMIFVLKDIILEYIENLINDIYK
tara:strand:+ start:653 stop:874 length:222 start_codon:yes stop_codon:yes gene_type:complete